MLYVLPFLVARALLPAGFMPTLQDGELRLAFCGVVMATPADGGETGSADPHPFSSDDHCPFSSPALVAFPVLPPIAPLAVAVVPPAAVPVFFQPTTGPPRVFGSRAPPVQFSA